MAPLVTAITKQAVPLIIAGTGAQAYGQIQAGQAAKRQGEAERAIMEYNARILEQQGKAEEQAAEYRAEAQERAGERFLAKQRVLFGKGGVEMRGTPLSVITETAEELEADRLMILREGTIARQYRESQAGMARMQGAAAKQRGKYAARGSVLAAGGTLLTGFGQAGYMSSLMKSGYLKRTPTV